MFRNQLRFIVRSDIAVSMITSLLPSLDEPISELELNKARQLVNQLIEEFHSQQYGHLFENLVIGQYLELIDIGYELVSKSIQLPFGIDMIRLLDNVGHVLITVSVTTYRLEV